MNPPGGNVARFPFLRRSVGKPAAARMRALLPARDRSI